jgi:transcriptional regulator GlxA family with amidase domain
MKFVFLLLPEIHLMDLAGPDQTLHEANGFGADFVVEYCVAYESLSSSAGLDFAKQKHYSEIDLRRGDFLIVPGSNISFLTSEEFKKNWSLKNWIKEQYGNGVKLCSICSGAFVLAECGLLDGKPCTTHFKSTERLQALFPKVKVTSNILFTQHENIYTSAGIASGIDLMLHIIEEIKGNYFSHMIARELVVYNRRHGAYKQQSDLLRFRNHIHSGIHKVQDWIVENIDKKSSLGDLAKIACMSERNFTRVFKKETMITVNSYLTVIRKEKVKELIKNPDLSRIEIAREVGLESDRQLSRLIKNL